MSDFANEFIFVRKRNVFTFMDDEGCESGEVFKIGIDEWVFDPSVQGGAVPYLTESEITSIGEKLKELNEAEDSKLGG